MKAFTIDRYKPSDGGRIADVTEPVPANDQVLVQIHPAGVNLLDSKIRSGEFKVSLPYRMPLILGHDVAGEVVGVAPGVRRFNLGDEMYARPDTAAIARSQSASRSTKPTRRPSRDHSPWRRQPPSRWSV